MTTNFSNIVSGATRVSSSFSAKRFHPTLKKYRGHEGVDIAAPLGSAIYSPPVDGVVVQNGNDTAKGGFGYYLVVRTMFDGVPIFTVYGHLKSPSSLKRDAIVLAGTKIGEVGVGGTGPHLHYEERIGLP